MAAADLWKCVEKLLFIFIYISILFIQFYNRLLMCVCWIIKYIIVVERMGKPSSKKTIKVDQLTIKSLSTAQNNSKPVSNSIFTNAQLLSQGGGCSSSVSKAPVDVHNGMAQAQVVYFLIIILVLCVYYNLVAIWQ